MSNIIDEYKRIGIEKIAREIHNSAREAVLTGATVAHDKFGENAKKFTEWDELSENAREGKIMQAKYLLERYYIIPKFEGEEQ